MLGARRCPGGITSPAHWPGPSPAGPWSPSSPPPARAPACCPLHPPMAAGGSDLPGPCPLLHDRPLEEQWTDGNSEGFRQHLGPPETGSGAQGGASRPRDRGGGGRHPWALPHRPFPPSTRRRGGPHHLGGVQTTSSRESGQQPSPSSQLPQHTEYSSRLQTPHAPASLLRASS